MNLAKRLGFRTEFQYSKRIFWHPPHQAKALQQLKKGLHHIDLIVEVRDARIPLTSISKEFDDILGNRPRLIIYNKSDLSNPSSQKQIRDAFMNYKELPVAFTTADQGKNIKIIIEHAVALCRTDPIRFPYMSIVVVGCPNVGKSTLINSLRNLGCKKGKVTQVGKKAGVTTKIQTRVKIFNDPPIYLVDTPGIYNPHITSPLDGLKIALTGATNDCLTTPLNIADYLLFRLNNCALIKTYYNKVGLSGPTDNIEELALYLCKKNSIYVFKIDYKFKEKGRIMKNMPLNCLNPEYDLDKGAMLFIEMYRDGVLGKMTLDDCRPQALLNHFNPLGSNNQ